MGRTKNTQLPIEVVLNENIKELLKEAPLFYVDETVTSIMQHAQLLKTDPVVATEEALSKDNLERIHLKFKTLRVDGTGIHQLSKRGMDTTVVNDEQFSFIKTLENADGLISEEYQLLLLLLCIVQSYKLN